MTGLSIVQRGTTEERLKCMNSLLIIESVSLYGQESEGFKKSKEKKTYEAKLV